MKAGSAFITPLSGLALELLCPHLKTDASAPMFDLHPHELYRATRSIVAELGMNRWTSHDLRRTRQRRSIKLATRSSRSARCSRTPGKGVTAIYARWDKFALRREMALVVERALRETLGNKPAVVAARTAA